jgi:hypothetical protein
MMTSWYSQLDRAKSVADVVAVARDFLATWTPEDLALLPAACRPGRLRDEQDIEALHGTLVEAYRDSRATGKELDVLQRLTSFIVRTSIRLSELGGDYGGGGGGGVPSSGSGKSASPRES